MNVALPLTGLFLIALDFMLIAPPESLARILGFTRGTHDAEGVVALLRRLEQQVSQYLRVVTAVTLARRLNAGSKAVPSAC